MNNVCLPSAIRSLCRVRPSNTIPARQLFCGFHKLRCAPRSISILRPGTTGQQTGQLAIESCLRKELGNTLRYSTLPSAGLKSSKTKASHTEGVLDTESWRDYDPNGGLPLPDGELDQKAIDEIYGPHEMDVDNGNYILCVMNWRRMSGSLIDVGVKFPEDSDVTSRQAIQALEYLRQEYPAVDEETLAARWVEEESQKLRQQLQDRAVRLGLYKADTPQEEAEEEEEEPEEMKQGTAYGRARTGTSMLERVRAANKLKYEAEDRVAAVKLANKKRTLLAAARGPLELSGGLQQQVGLTKYGNFAVTLHEPNSSASLARSEPPAWVKYYQDQAQIIKENAVPQMSVFRRLVPSAAVFLLTISGCYYFATHYTPPSAEARLFPSIPPSVATLGAITAVMVGMFIAGKVPPFWRTLNKYFTVVPAYPFAISTLGALLRHDTFFHLLNNTILLWAIGLTLHEDVGRGWFLATFVGAGVTGTMGALTYHVLARNWSTYIFGASGAMLGMLSAVCVLRPQGTVTILGYELPFAAWAVLALVGFSQLQGVFRGFRQAQLDNVDYLGHAFGMLGGVVTAFGLRARFEKDDKIAKQEVLHTDVQE